MFPWLTKLVTKDRPDPKISLQRDCSDDFDSIDRDVAAASTLLGRPDTFQDSRGFTREILAAKVHQNGKRVVYVESRSKERLNGGWSVTIKIRWISSLGFRRATLIKSYNPFFGCQVGFIEWLTPEIALVIYTEKHRTYAVRVGDLWYPRFVEIEDRWRINDNTLSFIAYGTQTVQLLELPNLSPRASITAAQAEVMGLLPGEPYGEQGAAL